MRHEAARQLADGLELELHSAGICLACLTFVAFPLDSGDERKARGAVRAFAPDFWAEGLELTAKLALETARRDGVAQAEEAIADVRRHGARSVVVRAIVWRLAELMVEELRASRAVRAPARAGR